MANIITNFPPRAGYTQEQIDNVKIITEYFTKKGWYIAAIAGLLGNVEQESYIKPDISEFGSAKGYGLVQWTCSSDTTMLGVQYVQTLLKQAGISGDYRNIYTQLDLLNWHLYNGGQYLPNENGQYPYSATAFTQLTDPRLAARVFEMNFERPQDPHPERADMASGWYAYLTGNGSTGSGSTGGGATTYTVKSGDTLSAIASKYGVTVSQLMEWNGISNANLIQIEQVLKVTGSTIPVTSIILSPGSITLSKGETYKLLATVNPSNATNQTITWKTSNSAAVTVSGGNVRAVSLGTATITATVDGKSTTSTVNVNNVKATSITLNTTTIGLLSGASYTLTATVNPSDATNKTITWSTSDSGIATVSGGVVKGIAVGKTSITAKNAANGISAACTINVRTAPSAIIKRIYEKGLARTPSTSEISGKTNNLVSGKYTWADTIIEFFLGAEYTLRKTNNETYVKNLYEALIGRTADTSGLNYYKTFIDNGVSRRYVLYLFGKSAEFATIIKPFNCTVGAVQLTEARDLYSKTAIFVNKHYLGGLKRNADTDGLNYHTKRLAEKTVTAANFALAILDGTEYKNKKTSNEQFVIDLYKAILFRTPDDGGKKYHLGRLTSGTSRTDVMKSFVNSAEYQLICNDYGVTRGTL